MTVLQNGMPLKPDMGKAAAVAAAAAAPTRCLQSPEVWELLDRIKQVVKPYSVQLLCEVHEDFVGTWRWQALHACYSC
jgi:hypothetical protein